ncbi:MAG TPA: phage holin family protein [Dehalococcoidia bacterium]|nr:phage holin family protein [Dehalococcoidia bacterium]
MSQERLVVLAVRWLILAAAVWVAAEVLPGIRLEGWGSTLIVALILGLLNLYVRPVLFWLSIPATILTLGLFLIVLNAMLLGLADWIANIDDDIRFDVEGVFDAILGAIIISVVSTVIGWFVDAQRIARGVSGRW